MGGPTTTTLAADPPAFGRRPTWTVTPATVDWPLARVTVSWRPAHRADRCVASGTVQVIGSPQVQVSAPRSPRGDRSGRAEPVVAGNHLVQSCLNRSGRQPAAALQYSGFCTWVGPMEVMVIVCVAG